MSVLRVRVVNVRLSGHCLIDSDGRGGGKIGTGRRTCRLDFLYEYLMNGLYELIVVGFFCLFFLFDLIFSKER